MKGSIIKIFNIIIFVFILLGCDGGIGSSSVSQDGGIYLGIIGFNEDVTKQNMVLLDKDSKADFGLFINNLEMKPATCLYYAVDEGLKMIKGPIYPENLQNVSIITFTDGLDTASTMLNEFYSSKEEYLTYVNEQLTTSTVYEIPIRAYSIGIDGDDAASDPVQFEANLQSLATASTNVYSVENMAAVNSSFETIATSLTNTSSSQDISLKVTGGYSSGTKFRFTFDGSTNGSSSIYIEGIFENSGGSFSLTSVSYVGFTPGGSTVVNGVVDGVYVTFTFSDTKTSAGGLVSTTNVDHWWYKESSESWQPNSEFGGTGDVEVTVTQDSAAILLVLDCSTSLGTTNFSEMKTSVNNFIRILYNNLGLANEWEDYSVTSLYNGSWEYASISSSDEWFSFSPSSYDDKVEISWKDFSEGGYSGDVYVSAYNEDGVQLFSNVDKGYVYPKIIDVSDGKTIYLKAVLQNNRSGSYRIRYTSY